MRKVYYVLVILLISLSSAFAANIGDLQFSDDFGALLSASQTSRRPLLIDFYTDWCVWCKVLADSTMPDPYVQRFLRNFELGKINAELDTAVADRYRVRSFPTVLLLNSQGEEIDRIVGYLPPEEFVTAIVNSLAGVGTLQDLLKRLKLSPDDPDLTFEVAEKYMYRGYYDDARPYFRKLIDRGQEKSKGKASTSAYRLAYMRYKEKAFTAAAQMYADMAAAYPGSEEAGDAELMVAYCYQKAEQFDQARQQYQLLLDRQPDTEEREWIEEQLNEIK